MRFLFSLLLLASVLFACKEKKASAAEIPAKPIQPAAEVEKPKELVDSIFLTYQRTPCFGMCPVFNLTILKSGQAIYEGKNFTDRIGFYQSKIDETALQRIMFVADSIGYFSLEENYDNDKVTDLPTTTTSLLKNGSLRKVANRYKAPKSLQVLYKELDAMIESVEWKPRSNY